MIHNPYSVPVGDIAKTYLKRIYEPYEYLRSKGLSYLDLKGGQTLILFETYEGAVKYFEEYIYHTTPDGRLTFPQKKGVRYVIVQNTGRYTAVSFNQQIPNHTIYVNFHEFPQNHPVYHSYVGWAYLQRSDVTDQMTLDASRPITMGMICQHCGQSTYDVDTEYLYGTNHLECELKTKWRKVCTTTTP